MRTAPRPEQADDPRRAGQPPRNLLRWPFGVVTGPPRWPGYARQRLRTLYVAGAAAVCELHPGPPLLSPVWAGLIYIRPASPSENSYFEGLQWPLGHYFHDRTARVSRCPLLLIGLAVRLFSADLGTMIASTAISSAISWRCGSRRSARSGGRSPTPGPRWPSGRGSRREGIGKPVVIERVIRRLCQRSSRLFQGA